MLSLDVSYEVDWVSIVPQLSLFGGEKFHLVWFEALHWGRGILVRFILGSYLCSKIYSRFHRQLWLCLWNHSVSDASPPCGNSFLSYKWSNSWPYFTHRAHLQSSFMDRPKFLVTPTITSRAQFKHRRVKGSKDQSWMLSWRWCT